MTRYRNLSMIFTSPSAVAQNVAQDPHWILPFVVIMVVSLVFTVGTYRFQIEAQREMMESVTRDSDENHDVDSLLRDSPARRAMVGAMAAGFAAITMLVVAAVLNGIASFLGKPIGFRRMFAFYAYAGLIGTVGVLVKIPLVFAKGSIDVRTSIAAFAPGVALDSPLGVALNMVDVFAIWVLVATCIGYNTLSGLGTRRSVSVVVGLYALWMLISIGLAVMRSSLMGAS